jgi:hypothetical protein
MTYGALKSTVEAPFALLLCDADAPRYTLD